MKALLLAASAALLVTACTTPLEEDMPPPAMAEPAGMPAPAYMEMAASSDMFEIQSGQLALQRACDPAVRGFAQQIVADHTRMSNMMMSTAQANNLPPPPMGMAPHHAAMLQRLQAAPAQGFDAAFRTEQIAAHQEALSLHRGYAEDGDHAAMRGLAAQAVPAIEMHLQHAQTLPTATPCPGTQTEQMRRAGERG
jgi:putative membrane protein